MNPDKQRQDDDQMAALFASVDHDGAPPDREFLAKLRERSKEAFLTADNDIPTVTPSRRNPRMFILAARGLTALAATAVLITAWFVGTGKSGATEDSFAEVLDVLAEADTLQLEVTLAGRKHNAWVRQPGQMRMNMEGGIYQVALKGRAWTVDEAANRAASRPVDYFSGKDGTLDPLRFLDLSLAEAWNRDSLLAKAPNRRIDRGGRPCDVYRWETTGNVRVEAIVDVKTRMLQVIESATVRDGRAEPLASMKVVAIDEPVDEELFVVGDTLTEDGRIGKVTDAQGIVAVKPVMHRRWTPVTGR